MLLVFVSFENKKDADKVANYLIDHHLAACISLVRTKSFYFWKRKKVRTNEIEGIIKTTRGKLKSVQDAIGQLLSYEIPQIIAVEAKDVNEKYKKWVEGEVNTEWT
ncbi:MAG: divalent-cation tolerance protein CutA [Candidatus Levybacteria bacterium]|nr:divalent-cation tolerance protein CutA [Candidatus Levybacteria bacterium]